MNISVGLIEGATTVAVELAGSFKEAGGKAYLPGRYQFNSDITLIPDELSSCSFAIDDVTIGIGFHWERKERQVFRGSLRIVSRQGLTVINDVPLEEYVTSVISSEMSASCPVELLKAHAVISRSWLWHPRSSPESVGAGNTSKMTDVEITRWYGREAHRDFDVCADDHCQRYQGITKTFSAVAAQAVQSTAHEMLVHEERVCDARFSKCCGGWTEKYSSAWDDREVPYLICLYDGEGEPPSMPLEDWITSAPPAWCNSADATLLAKILPGFDQETNDFYRWTVRYTAAEVGELLQLKLGIDLGRITGLYPLQRGPSGRITRLRIEGDKRFIIIGKELEIRRALSRSHLYSSAFVVTKEGDQFTLRGAGWGHGVGLCQIGAAVMASKGKGYQAILRHYYPGTEIKVQQD